MSRTIAIGDIHGCAIALQRLIDEIKPTSNDIIIGMGDYVDRGMNSAGVLEILINLVSTCRFIPLIGNHELMMYKALFGDNKKRDFEFWYQHGGSATLASYGGSVEGIPQHHLSFLNHCLRYYETEEHFFIHANYAPDLPLSEQPDQISFWKHMLGSPTAPHVSGKIAYVGHTPQSDGHVTDHGHVKLIDTYCYGDEWLSAVNVLDGEVWQTNNSGDYRSAKVEPSAENE